eukprot:TRINITY_DN4531_c0_g1_i1.p1 TRINITY_DN4531_c0_g1~~TRINITY_DN4531_c0_g1_i1.p1  ORF type:complete len:278 (-),score=58.16 TRINITY_DN4531_c0_g1_i1:148-981(-)
MESSQFNTIALGTALALAVGAFLVKFVLGGKKKAPISLDPKEYRKFKLVDKTIISHNTRLFRFALPTPDSILGLPIGQHISLKAVVDEKDVMRSYTPVSSDDEKGYFDLIIKVYERGVMSQYVDHLVVGQDSIDVRGPKGAFVYQTNMFRSIGMIAGGTGITPMLQVIRAILKNKSDTTQIRLIFANVNEDDILLREDLDRLVVGHPNFKIYYVLNNPPAGWTGGVGFVSQEMIQNFLLPPGSENTKVVMCGPPMMNKAMQGHLTAIGYTEEQVFQF